MRSLLCLVVLSGLSAACFPESPEQPNDPAPEQLPGDEPFRIQALNGKADLLVWNITADPGAVGQVAVVSNHGLKIDLKNDSLARADITVYIGTRLVAQSPVMLNPYLDVPDYGDGITYTIVLVNRSVVLPFRNAQLHVDRGPFEGGGDGDGDGEDLGVPSGAAHIISGPASEISSGEMEEELEEVADIDWRLDAFGFNASPADVASVAVLIRGDDIRIQSGNTDDVEDDVNFYTSLGWQVHSFHYRRQAPSDVATILWLHRDGEFKSFLGSSDDIKEELEFYTLLGWQPHTFIYRGSGEAVVWVERNGEWDALIDRPNEVEDMLELRTAAGWQPHAFLYNGREDSVAWLRCGERYRAFSGDSPSDLADWLNLAIGVDASCHPVAFHYSGDRSVAWLMRGDQLRAIRTSKMRQLDEALDYLYDVGWSLVGFEHRGPQAAVALFSH